MPERRVSAQCSNDDISTRESACINPCCTQKTDDTNSFVVGNEHSSERCVFRDEFAKRRNQSIENLCGEVEPPSIGKSDECQRNEENFRLHRHEEKKRKEKREHQQSVPTNKRDSFGKEVWRLPSYVSGGKEKEYKCSGERDNPRSNTASYRHPQHDCKYICGLHRQFEKV